MSAQEAAHNSHYVNLRCLTPTGGNRATVTVLGAESGVKDAPPVALVASATAALHPPMRGEAGVANGAGGGRAADNCITSGVVQEPPLKTTPPTGPSRAGVAG